MLMELKSLKLLKSFNTAWHVGAKSTFAVGKDMGHLKILGYQQLIWEMLRNWYLSMSVFRLCLGSQSPGEGVVLGPDHSQHSL